MGQDIPKGILHQPPLCLIAEAVGAGALPDRATAGPYQVWQSHQQLLTLDTKAAECKAPSQRVIILCCEKVRVPRCPAVLVTLCLYLETRQVQQDIGSSSSFMQHLMLHAHVKAANHADRHVLISCMHIMQQQLT